MTLSAIRSALGERTVKQHWRGTHRARSPEETLAAYGEQRRALGITRLANVTGLDRLGLPVCVAVRPNARSLATSQGKGETLAAAMVSAMMESIELWHAERLALPMRYESWSELLRAGERVPVAEQLPVRADATFDVDRPVPWIEGLDLMTHRPCWVPYELVSINLVRQPGQSAIFLESTNGLASGNHLSEALVHGLCEVIERDAMALWELFDGPRRKARQIDLATIDDPHLTELIERLARKGVVVGAWDTTSDVGVPTYSAVIAEDPASDQWRPIPAYFGAGTHLDPVIALSRALHEAVQSRLTAISGSRDDMFNADYVRAGNRDDHARLVAMLRDAPATLPFRPATLPFGTTCQDDLDTLLAQLTAVGVDSIVAFDLGRDDVGIPVAKVVVPALEPYFTPLYRPGQRARRLATVLQ